MSCKTQRLGRIHDPPSSQALCIFTWHDSVPLRIEFLDRHNLGAFVRTRSLWHYGFLVGYFYCRSTVARYEQFVSFLYVSITTPPTIPIHGLVLCLVSFSVVGSVHCRRCSIFQSVDRDNLAWRGSRACVDGFLCGFHAAERLDGGLTSR